MNEFQKDDYFKVDPEPHLIGNMEVVKHFPGVQMWWKAVDAIHRPILEFPSRSGVVLDSQ